MRRLALVEQYRLRMERPDTFGAYLSGDGLRVTTWTGDTLGYVERGSLSKWRNVERVAFRFTMGGRRYNASGGGEGMYCTARAAKGVAQ